MKFWLFLDNINKTIDIMSTQRAVLHNSCSTVGVLLEKIDPVLCLAGKMKYICWETLKNFLRNRHYRCETAKIFGNFEQSLII